MRVSPLARTSPPGCGADAPGNGSSRAVRQGWQVPLKTTPAHGAARSRGDPHQQHHGPLAQGHEGGGRGGFQGSAPRPDHHAGPGRVPDTTRRCLRRGLRLPGALRHLLPTWTGGYTTDPRITKKGAQARPDRLSRKCGVASLGAKCCRRARWNSPIAPTKCEAESACRASEEMDDARARCLCPRRLSWKCKRVAGCGLQPRRWRDNADSPCDRPGIRRGPLLRPAGAGGGERGHDSSRTSSEHGRTDDDLLPAQWTRCRGGAAMSEAKRKARINYPRPRRDHRGLQGLGRGSACAAMPGSPHQMFAR